VGITASSDTVDFNSSNSNSSSESDSSDEKSSETKTYVLIGLSHELNRSALLNIGWALAPNDTKGKDTQFYVGFTLDSNLLKSLGIIAK
jgi:hypothetical protein